ncbi:MAG: Rap1a/Tai family immunity protein [Pseudomonadota bacterium]|nr:Rap1a/Tai family immunity protein [Pseudomonadota bacterium]
MKKLYRNSIGLICLLGASYLSAEARFPQVSVHNTQRLNITTYDVSGQVFWEAYMSKDVAQRRFAEMYLVGVLDNSEGDKWCGYEVALSGSIQEQIYLGFKKISKESMNTRASELIVSILSDILPCKSS